jgi:hypothetical protein
MEDWKPIAVLLGIAIGTLLGYQDVLTVLLRFLGRKACSLLQRVRQGTATGQRKRLGLAPRIDL